MVSTIVDQSMEDMDVMLLPVHIQERWAQYEERWQFSRSPTSSRQAFGTENYKSSLIGVLKTSVFLQRIDRSFHIFQYQIKIS